VRDWTQPGNLNELIARVNQIRRDYPALQFNDGLRFHATDNQMFLWFSKSVPSGVQRSPRIFVVVNTDPHWMQHGHVHVPIGELGIPAGRPYTVEDLLDGAQYTWHGEWNYVKLDPRERMAHILVIRD
jgi:starch synthase (maltosyl-transferring)